MIQSIKLIEYSQAMAIYKRVSRIKQILPLSEREWITRAKVFMSYNYNLKARYRWIYVFRSKTKKEHQQQRKIRLFNKGITRVLWYNLGCCLSKAEVYYFYYFKICDTQKRGSIFIKKECKV